ncbi:hypothetical protein BH09BAC1_BH09BAC1_22750 [soil metagenome]
MIQERLEQLKAMLVDNPADSFLLYAIAQEYIKQGEQQEALKFFDNLLISNPHYTGTYYHLGKLHEAMGNITIAIETYKKGLEITRQRAAHHDHNELKGALALIADDAEEDY